jgi:enterobactin synthetase component D
MVLLKSSVIPDPFSILHVNEYNQSQTYKSESRKREYARARWLLHHALPGAHDYSRQLDGTIQWPLGWRASISHSQGHVGIAIAMESDTLSVGFDLESENRVRPELAAKICRPDEWRHLISSSFGQEPQRVLARVFAAKESIYKAIYPLGKRQFWFEDAEVVPGSFTYHQLRLRVLADTADIAPAGSEFDVQLREVELDGAMFVSALSEINH